MGLEGVEIVMDIEDHFGIAMPDEVVNAETVGETHAAVVEILVRTGRQRSAELEAEVYRDLVAIIAKNMKIDATSIRPESRWVGDITRYG